LVDGIARLRGLHARKYLRILVQLCVERAEFKLARLGRSTRRGIGRDIRKQIDRPVGVLEQDLQVVPRFEETSCSYAGIALFQASSVCASVCQRFCANSRNGDRVPHRYFGQRSAESTGHRQAAACRNYKRSALLDDEQDALPGLAGISAGRIQDRYKAIQRA